MIQQISFIITFKIIEFNLIFFKREMLTSALKVLVNNPFKESFYGKLKKKKEINILTVFFIFHKSGIKTFLK